MQLLSHLNYLHYGNALDRLLEIDTTALPESLPKSAFMRQIFGVGTPDPFISAIINGYGSPGDRYIDTRRFREDLYLSQRARLSFAELNCRGFSHCFWSGPVGFPYRLRSQINLRLVLAANPRLFYPQKIKRYVVGHWVSCIVDRKRGNIANFHAIIASIIQ